MHAVLDGICRGAFNPYKWVEANRENFLDLNEDIAGRFDFLGEEVTTDKVNKYLQKNCHGMSQAMPHDQDYSYRLHETKRFFT